MIKITNQGLCAYIIQWFPRPLFFSPLPCYLISIRQQMSVQITSYTPLLLYIVFCIYSFTINVTYFEHAKTLKSLSKVIFVSRLVGAQISRETCNLDKARSGIRSPAPVWSWLGHGEAAVCLTSVLDAHQHLSIYCLSIQYQLALIFHNFCLWREKKKRTKIQTMNEKC